MMVQQPPGIFPLPNKIAQVENLGMGPRRNIEQSKCIQECRIVGQGNGWNIVAG